MATAPSGWRRLGNVAFLVFFAGYACFAVAVLAFGAAAVVAFHNQGFHDHLHYVWGVDDTLWGWLAERLGEAAHRRHQEPIGDLIIDYGFSLFNLSLAFFLVFLRRQERTACLLAVRSWERRPFSTSKPTRCTR
ncbi:MAG: hypothetical protein M3P34_07305 [Actinomycetota bacterium]|nr:hypothetical protein [Actinomycetota bacterium]